MASRPWTGRPGAEATLAHARCFKRVGLATRGARGADVYPRGAPKAAGWKLVSYRVRLGCLTCPPAQPSRVFPTYSSGARLSTTTQGVLAQQERCGDRFACPYSGATESAYTPHCQFAIFFAGMTGGSEPDRRRSRVAHALMNSPTPSASCTSGTSPPTQTPRRPTSGGGGLGRGIGLGCVGDRSPGRCNLPSI